MVIWLFLNILDDNEINEFRKKIDLLNLRAMNNHSAPPGLFQNGDFTADVNICLKIILAARKLGINSPRSFIWTALSLKKQPPIAETYQALDTDPIF